MTPAELLIATTFPGTPITAKILRDRVILSIRTQTEANQIVANCDALLPPLELTRSPLLVYVHCEENQGFQELDRNFMEMMAIFNSMDWPQAQAFLEHPSDHPADSG